MKIGLVTWSLLLGVALLTPCLANASCTDYEDFGDVRCSGAGGCVSSHPSIICGFGCISGTCNSRGSSGECCGNIYYVANISPDGGRGCTQAGCGELRSRNHSSSVPSSPEHRAELLKGYSPGVVLLSERLSYKEPQIIYALDRCNHNFGFVVSDGRVVAP